MRYFLCLLALLGTMHARATLTIRTLEKQFPKEQSPPRIRHLWPESYIANLAIDPAIPENFTLKQGTGAFDAYFAWGPKKVLNRFTFAQPSSLTDAIIVWRYTPNIAQTGPKSFSGFEDEQALLQSTMTDPKAETLMWGPYPVRQINGLVQGKYIGCAWMGCNYNSHVMFAHLRYPVSKDRPNQSDIALWENFLANTKPLLEQEYALAQGYDMREGYTWVDHFGITLLCTVEIQSQEHKARVIVIPISKNTRFLVNSIDFGLSDQSWLEGKPLCKVMASLSRAFPDGTRTEMPETYINVIAKQVEQFSINPEQLPSEAYITQLDLK